MRRVCQVEFEPFCKWWKYKKQEYRRDLKNRVKTVFALVDSDGSGELSKNEVNKMYEIVLKKLPGTIEFFPPFDLEIDFQMMQAVDQRSPERIEQVKTVDPEGHGVVNDEEFAAWFKIRTNDEDPTMPVRCTFSSDSSFFASPSASLWYAPASASASVGSLA